MNPFEHGESMVIYEAHEAMECFFFWASIKIDHNGEESQQLLTSQIT